jgi:ATP-dependent Lon protease
MRKGNRGSEQYMVNIPKFFKNQEGGNRPRSASPAAAEGHRCFPAHGGAAFCRAQQIRQRAFQCHEQGQAHFSGHPENAGVDNPKEKDICDVGVIGSVLQLLRLPDGTVKALVEGTQRPASSGMSQPGIL